MKFSVAINGYGIKSKAVIRTEDVEEFIVNFPPDEEDHNYIWVTGSLLRGLKISNKSSTYSTRYTYAITENRDRPDVISFAIARRFSGFDPEFRTVYQEADADMSAGELMLKCDLRGLQQIPNRKSRRGPLTEDEEDQEISRAIEALNKVRSTVGRELNFGITDEGLLFATITKTVVQRVRIGDA